MKRKCFVLMPFDDDLQDVYQHAIYPAATEAGFDCFRADQAVAPRSIVSDIIRSIFDADVIVADLSRSNPNVFYELGVAHSVGNKAIMICEKTKQDLPFDLKAYFTIFYQRSIPGIQDSLRGKLLAALRELDDWSTRPSNPVQDFRPVKYRVPLREQAALEARMVELEAEVRQLRFENRRRELLVLIFSLPEIEIVHLRNLAAEKPYRYEKRVAFLQELRHLRGLGLIQNKPDATIGGLPESGDLKEHIELDPIVEEFFRDISRWLKRE